MLSTFAHTATRARTRLVGARATATASPDPEPGSPHGQGTGGAASTARSPHHNTGEAAEQARASTAVAAAAASVPSRSPRKRKRTECVALDPPNQWRATYDLIWELRADRTAVVDSMGTEVAAGKAQKEEDRAYHVLVSLMLSSQTRDTVNAVVMDKLRRHGLTVPNIIATPEEQLLDLIKEVGFKNNKVRFIKETTRIIADTYGGCVPDTMDQILALPGVGPKMGLILLNVAFGRCEGISVDTHVHRISNQLGWAGPEGAKTPEKTRKALESWMPREVWPEVNLLLVGFGQEIQTEKGKLLRKCIACSAPPRALALVARCGLNIERELKKAGLDLPPGVDLSQLRLDDA